MPGQRVNCSLDTLNWQVATKRMRDWEIEGAVIEDTRVAIADACEAMRADCAARGLAPATLKKFRVLLGQLGVFSEEKGIAFVQEFTPPLVRLFRESWKDAPLAASKSSSG